MAMRVFQASTFFQMAPWVRKTFIDFLPKFLFIKRPDPEEGEEPLTWNHNQGVNGVKGSNSKLPISRSLTTTQDSTDDDEMDDGGMVGNTAKYIHSMDHRSLISNSVNNKPPLQQLQLHAPSCDGSLLGNLNIYVIGAALIQMKTIIRILIQQLDIRICYYKSRCWSRRKLK